MAGRAVVRIVSTLLGICAAAILALNVENVATRLGFDQVLADAIAPKPGRSRMVPAFFTAAPTIYAALIALGLSLGVWIDYVLKQIEQRRGKIKTSDQEWDSAYRKVRAMQRRLQDAIEVCDSQPELVPQDLTYEIWSLEFTLTKIGLRTPLSNPHIYNLPDYLKITHGYLTCIAPFMRDKHTKAAKAIAKARVKDIRKAERHSPQSPLGTATETQP